MVNVLAFIDEPALAAGLEAVLTVQDDTQLRCVDSLSALWSALEVESPDLILLSLTPDVSLHTIRTIAGSASGSKVVLWLRSIDPAIGGESIRAGVRGILRKTLPNELLLKCIRKVSAGELWIEKSLAGQLLESRAHLTARELELLSAVAHGLRNKEIAALLQLTEASVKIYVSRLLKKLALNDRLELALYGLKHNGTLPLEQSMPALLGGSDPWRAKPKTPVTEVELVVERQKRRGAAFAQSA